jgi:hypothetical protein
LRIKSGDGTVVFSGANTFSGPPSRSRERWNFPAFNRSAETLSSTTAMRLDDGGPGPAIIAIGDGTWTSLQRYRAPAAES